MAIPRRSALGGRRRRLIAGTALLSLVVVVPAGSRPAAGIMISASEPVTAIIGAPDVSSGLYQYGVVVAARFSPEVLHDDARVTFTSIRPGGSGYPPFTGNDAGNVMHTTAVYQSFFAAVEGERLLVTARWNAYTPQPSGTVSGKKTSPPHVVSVPMLEPAPRLRPETKQEAAQDAGRLYQKCAAFGALSLAVPGLAGVAAQYCAIADRAQELALDPVDMNFRVVPKPRTPTAHRLTAGSGISSAAAAALNKLLALQAREIGLAGAIATAINRSQGAHLKKQVEWEKKQVQAAGRYAAQYATLVLTEARMSPGVRRAFTSPGNVSEEQALAFQASLLNGPLPAPITRSLSRLGFSKAGLKEIEAQLIVRNHPTVYDGNAFAALADPLHLAIRRQVAAGFRAFAKKAARDPLNTGT